MTLNFLQCHRSITWQNSRHRTFGSVRSSMFDRSFGFFVCQSYPFVWFVSVSRQFGSVSVAYITNIKVFKKIIRQSYSAIYYNLTNIKIFVPLTDRPAPCMFIFIQFTHTYMTKNICLSMYGCYGFSVARLCPNGPV